MRSSIARRPVASPCLLCMLRATATAERSIPRTASRRRFNRRVHSSANRLAGENLASRPEPEDGGLHGIPTSQKPSSFAGFGSNRTASIAASKWGRKPTKPLEEPAPAPAPTSAPALASVPPNPPEPQQAERKIGQQDQIDGHYHFRPPTLPQESIQQPIAVEPVNTQAELTPDVVSQDTQAPRTEPVEIPEDSVNLQVEAQNAESIHTSADQFAVEADHNQGISPVLETADGEPRVTEASAIESQDVQNTPSILDTEAPAVEFVPPIAQEISATPTQEIQGTQELPVTGVEAPTGLQAETEALPGNSIAEQQTQTIPPVEPEIVTVDSKGAEASLDTTAPINAAAELQHIQAAPLSEAQVPEVSTSEPQTTKELSCNSTQAQDVSTLHAETDFLPPQEPIKPVEPTPIPSVEAVAQVQSIASTANPKPVVQQPLSFLDKPINSPEPAAVARKSAHASTPGMSWAQRELAAMPAPATSGIGRWARASAEAKAPQGLSFQSPASATSAIAPKAGSWAAAADSQARQNTSAEDLKFLRKQHAQSLPTFEKSATPQESLTRNSEIKSRWRTAASGVGKWGISTKKSVFAASDSNDILDQLSGKNTTPAASGDNWQRTGGRRTFGERDNFGDDMPQRSFQEFKSGGNRYGLGNLEFGHTNLVDEALAEAGITDEVVGGGKKSKKERRRRAELEAKAAQEEAQDWSRRSSAKEKDKAKHSRQWATEDDPIEEVETKAQMKERKRLEREQKAKERAEMEQQLPPILIPEFVSVNTLARLCKVKLEPFTRKMEELGFTETNPDHVLNAEMAGLISMEYGFEPIVDKSHERDLVALPVPADKSVLPPRPPVVTIMGHVDHGKTTILDWLRKSSIVDQEHGGITQHIGAFSVNMPSGRNITFLDTPGHEAFLKMRERGANMTDIVILVVAADDSIMPQTIEAIKHAKAAGVPIIVAINKCDKEDADSERVKADLAQYDIQIEEVGGDTQVVCVSGKTGLGMEDLEEAVLLQADDIDMRAEATGRMEGWVVETSTKAKGRVATVLVRRGTLKKGDVIVAGTTWARVRNMITDTGVELEEALPGTPVEVDGWRDQPDAGDEILQAVTEDKAKSVVDYRLFKEERLQLAKDIEAINEARRLHHEKKEREARVKALQEQGMDAEEAAAQVPEIKQDDKFKVLEVPFIIKADVAGSVEAVEAQVLSVANEEARTTVIRTGVGALTESDIRMAESTGAYCLSFNVSNDPDIMALARFSNVKTIHHTVIYAILDDIKSLMSEKLKPTIVKTVVGEAEILQVFQYNVKKKVMRPFAGCKIYRGTVTKGYKAKVMRNGETVYDGTVETLKNVKKDAKEMTQGSECGMGFLDFDDFKEGDIVHCYTEVKKKRVFN
ncbi:hypothetical protein TWF225_003456 [Orbilia oligospora]|uniref:Translation initiation factor IF-2, mitochondrial n=1 Tax=Orbilia oligospora TaxID=2813651 RepID=A0A7C8TSU2_ORBOL|nr:hypothetical protein TWF751_000343 [Orbilia oligospora]KAF3188499.1 hypothetical protein TWF225_003456 [Orbilia oligospora]KAF3250117.1 hypothetical protein TWF128_007680 [Orbilia oligospora]KAF3263271.1 hypothetical protein TWF217_003695 [Orbilia oligospora]KAF3289121.1 hypothetical protein TWF132_007769 [Orbilia oligospora]